MTAAMTSLTAAAGISLTALILNYYVFSSIKRRFSSIEQRLDVIAKDVKGFFRELSSHDKRITKLEP
jgi:hypothetical protein